MKAKWFGMQLIVAVLMIAALPAASAAPGAKNISIFTGEDINPHLLSPGDKQAAANTQTIARQKYLPNHRNGSVW